MPSPYTKADYQIGIICALAIEAAAIVAMLDATHPKLPQDVTDINDYILGQIGDHNVIVACLPAGVIGNRSATTVAENMKRSFAIRFGLMVGIGGGVPSSKFDIRLGDVVVSQPTGDHGGVVQWDYGKTEVEGFRHTGTLNKPPEVLLYALQALKIYDETDGIDLEKLISVMVQKKPRMAEIYEYQGAEKDQLFRSTYDHVGGETCENCDRNQVVRLKVRKTTHPMIYYGNIASGNQVIKHGATRDRIAKQIDAICFEMEAAGLMDNFPCLVVRGICDYADSHKNKRWQRYAAATAAAFARTLLGFVKVQEVVNTTKPFRVLPFGRNEDFVGRQDHLDRLIKIFYTDDNKDNCQRVALDGLGGVGKTQIALQFAFELQKRSPQHSLFWVRASDYASFDKSYYDIGKELEIPGLDNANADVKELVKNRLSEDGIGKWLLIIDNADDFELFYTPADQGPLNSLSQCLPKSRLGGILFTTRDHRAATKFAGKNVIKVGDMDDVEARELLQTSLQDKQLINDGSSTTKLLELLVYLPLAIVQAVAYLNENGTTIAQYIRVYEESDDAMIKLLSEEFEEERRYLGLKNPIATTWLISFHQIQHQDPFAAEYMAFMSCIKEQEIPHTLLPRASGPLQTKAIGTLKAFAFIQERQEGLSYNMHRLVHIAMINWLKKEGTWTLSREKTLEHVANIFPWPEYENKSLWTTYLPHAENIIEITKHLNSYGSSLWELLDCIGRCLWLTGKDSKSQEIYQMSLVLKEKGLGKEHPNTLMSMGNLALALSNQGKFSEAEIMNRETLALREKVLGKEHPDTLTSMGNLALVLSDLGEYAEAEMMDRETLALREKVVGKEHPSTLTSMSNLALALSNQGKFSEAEIMNRETLALSEKVLGKEHPDTLTSMSNLALALSDQGKYAEAEIMDRETLALSEKVLGKEHPDTLVSMGNLALALSNQGKNAEAEMMNRETLALSEKVLGKEHPDTLVGMSNLAFALSNQGKHVEAEMMSRETLALMEKVLGKEHPDTLVSIRNLEFTVQQREYARSENPGQGFPEIKENASTHEQPIAPAAVGNQQDGYSTIGIATDSSGRTKKPGKLARAKELLSKPFQKKGLGRDNDL